MMNAKELFLKTINNREIYYFDEGKLKLNGYFYEAGPSTEGSPKTWRHVELCWCYPDMETFAQDRKAAIDEAETSCKQYITELTPEEVLQMFGIYANGEAPVPAVMSLDKFEELKKENKVYIDTLPIEGLDYDYLLNICETAEKHKGLHIGKYQIHKS